MTRAQGSSLIEVLVALSLLTLALTGLAPLLQHAVQLRLHSERLLQAQLMLQTLAEQMRGNAAFAAQYARSPGATPTAGSDCRSGFCDGPALAQWQLAQAAGSLPRALLGIACVDCGEAGRLRLQLYWDQAGTAAPLDCGAAQSSRSCLQLLWTR
ncbi:hypothetical protein SAMN04488038_10669 [Solimonas aquatica]|uniref:Type IV pilus assembly protein PilV n=1 Tax=Solimonas aquatica TaxID=489703 RepID=A0A1H9FS95_9GAMM|nr:prepilin-type N-terminal cleavage/methylation domain-containing protein [Solimonas aquatica]SEQ40383.1 hypothetical protein SAMN04488038_10669 [Solimonas aquatica]